MDNNVKLSELVEQTDGVPYPEDTPEDGTCRICGLDGPCYRESGSNGVFSNAFTSSDAFGPGVGVCYRCKHLAEQMDYRRYHWVASEDGVQVIKERPVLIDHLLAPPSGPWMAQYKDGSDFLTVLNGWIYAQALNTSRDRYRLLVDKSLVHIDRDRFAAMIAFGRELRGRDDAPSKRALKGGVTAGDLGRYDISRAEYRTINQEYVGRDDWRVAVQLIE